MSVDFTIRVPDELGHRLERYRDRLPEVLERGLREVAAEGEQEFGDESEIVSLLASRPTPEQVLALTPSAELQSRVSELLRRSKDGVLSTSESIELDRHLFLEHLVRVAKARALEQLAPGE